MPWTLVGFVLALCSGLLMFSAHAEDFLGNPIFLIKMSLIFVAGDECAVVAPRPVFAHARAWDVGGLPPHGRSHRRRLSIVLWLCVIACGRLLAYT